MYYRAFIKKEEVVHFVGLLRSVDDNIVFERIEKAKENIWEFFVAPDGENRFIEIMNLFLGENIIIWYKKENIQNSSLYNYI